MLSDKPVTNPYRCNFCKEHLVATKLQRSDYLLVLLLIRPYECPHCFSSFNRPLAWIGRLWPFRGDGPSLRSKASSQPGVLPVRDGDINGPVTRNVVRFGRWFEQCERKIGRGFAAVARFSLKVICFIPDKLAGNTERQSYDKFLKSDRSRSRERSRERSRDKTDEERKPPHRDKQA